MPQQTNDQPPPLFEGFDRPESNWFRMPNSWTDITAGIASIAELKVVEYILRHTWGYQEYGEKKHITIDEFVNGRRRADGGRMDRGTGLSERAVYDGLRKAVADGLIDEETDASDRGRIKKSYSLHMRGATAPHPASPPTPSNVPTLQDLQSGVQTLHPPLQTLQARGARSNPRTEKDTLERNINSNIRKALPNVDNSETPDARRRQSMPEAIGTTLTRSVLATQAATRRVGSAERANSAPPHRNSSQKNPTESVDGPRRERLRQVPQSDETYQILQAYMADFGREMGDRAPLRSSTMRAYNLYQRAGVSREIFIDQLYAARAIVKERTANIRSQGQASRGGILTKNKTAYLFAVLEDLLGLRRPTTDHDQQVDKAAPAPLAATAPVRRRRALGTEPGEEPPPQSVKRNR